MSNNRASQIQKEYYTSKADLYNRMYVEGDMDSGHQFALNFLSSIIRLNNIKSVLDVGAGTGRGIAFLQEHHPELTVFGAESIDVLREQAYKAGISQDLLVEGDANQLNYSNDEFDLVCEFGVLHHVPKPDLVVK